MGYAVTFSGMYPNPTTRTVRREVLRRDGTVIVDHPANGVAFTGTVNTITGEPDGRLAFTMHGARVWRPPNNIDQFIGRYDDHITTYVMHPDMITVCANNPDDRTVEGEMTAEGFVYVMHETHIDEYTPGYDGPIRDHDLPLWRRERWTWNPRP